MAGWDKIYPDKRIITLILDPFEAEELLDQALSEGKRIGERTIMGMPMIAFGDCAVEPESGERRAASGKPVDPVDLDNWRALGRKIEHETAPPAARPEENVVILPVVRREKLPEKPADPTPPTPPTQPAPEPLAPSPKPPVADTWSPFKTKARQQTHPAHRRSILEESPPRDPPLSAAEPKRRFNKAKKKWESRGRVSEADRALIDEAIAQGRVTKCPDFKHSVEPGELLPGEGWRKGKKRGPSK